jgi:hypothetical protein
VRRWIAIVGGLLLVAVVVVELVALPVATRLVGDAVDRCLSFEDLEVTAIDRPVTPRLLLGRARDVEVETSGLRYEGLRIERARLDLPEVRLPWGPGAPPPSEATLALEISESDLQEYLIDRAPLGLEPSLELTPGLIGLSVPPVPVQIQLEPEVRDGVLRLSPAGTVPAWFDALGLALAFDIPEDVEIERLEIEPQRLLALVRVTEIPGVVGSSDCADTLGAGGDDARREERAHG